MFSRYVVLVSICCFVSRFYLSWLFFFNDTSTTEIYTLSLHDALPILILRPESARHATMATGATPHGSLCSPCYVVQDRDRKSTRLNSSHANISYAVFCLKKKKKTIVHDINHYMKFQAHHSLLYILSKI